MNLNKNNYQELLKGISVIEVSGESCANCLTLLPILNRLMKDKEDVNFYHLELDDNTLEVADILKVRSVPTVLILKDKEEVARCRGFQPEEILDIWLDAKLEEARKM